MEWAFAVAMICSEPRLPFREFYERIYMVPYPGLRLEEMHIVNLRMAEGMASYIEYAEQYRDKCPIVPAAMCYSDGKRWPARKLGPSTTCYLEDAPK